MTEPQLSANALKVLERRYLKKDEEGKVLETPGQMFLRVARNIAQADLLYTPAKDLESVITSFYEMMARLLFLPNSPTLMNAGKDLQQLSACFVLPVEDSMESIFEALKNTALIHKSGGGTGFSFSRLRPKNDMVLSTKGIASGPISFMRIFDVATETIKQGGTRRGANMGILRVDHPDILEFITAKDDKSRLTNFNLSVGVTEEFMEAVEKDEMYDLINPRTQKVAGRLSARMVFDLIVHSAWKSGEPGIIFLKRLNRDNPTPLLGEIESTNPCGEQPLLPYESCNLGSINLSKMVVDGRLDWGRLGELVHSSVHFLDNVIDMNHYPLPQIESITKGNRKIGLGVMGFADMLIQMEIPYDSEEAVAAGEKIMFFIGEEARRASVRLAQERGPFPNFKGSIFESGHGRDQGRDREPPRRNATLTTIAPTGTLSIIANCSSGIEPLFALSYVRTVLDREQFLEVNPFFEATARREGFFSPELMEKVSCEGRVRSLANGEVPEKWRKVFATAYDISPDWHVRMQAAFQKHTDNAVSKTVNFPAQATEEDVARVYRLAYQTGCKGVTVYIQGSRESQVLSVEGTRERPATRVAGDSTQALSEPIPRAEPLKPRPRPEVTCGQTRKVITGCGALYVTINEDQEGIFEVFAQMGKSGGCAASQNETTGRMVSLALRSGIDVESILRQLRGIRCPSPAWEKGGMVLSCSDAIAKTLEKYLEEFKGMSFPREKRAVDGGMMACPDCGGTLEPESGCLVCRSCGFSKCS